MAVFLGVIFHSLPSHHCGWVIFRTLLLMSAEFVVDPRLFPWHFFQGLLVFILIKSTFRIPITTRRTISWEIWNFCSFILVCFLVAFSDWSKVFRQLWLQTRKTFTKKQNATRKNCEISWIFLTKLFLAEGVYSLDEV